MPFVASAASWCGAKSALEISDLCEANPATLAETVDLRHGASGHSYLAA
jgi:hypothetical protein